MRFDYSARDRDGQEHKGSIDAEDEGTAVRQLGTDGLTPVRLTPVGVSQARTVKLGRQRAKAADQTLLLRELATLLGAGVTLGDALPSLAQAYATQALGPALDALNVHVRGGGRLSEALADRRLRLPAFVLALTQAGEASGQLARALSEAADQMELDRKVAEELRSALIYPTVLVVAGTLAVLLIFVGVVPKFAPLIKGARSANVPEMSRWVIGSGVYLRAHLGEFGFGAAALAALLGLAGSRDKLRDQALQALLKLPGVGPWLLQSEIGRWATVLGTLLDNRVPIIDAMSISARVLRLQSLRSGLERAARSLQQGQTLTAALETQGWFPPSRLNLIRVGERSGELPKMLLALGRSQTEAARLMQRRLLTLIEPAAILLIGGVIGFVMIAVMTAITGMNQLAA